MKCTISRWESGCSDSPTSCPWSVGSRPGVHQAFSVGDDNRHTHAMARHGCLVDRWRRIWLMHFIAMLGFAVPGSPIRYNLGWTVISAIISVGAVFVGLLIIGTEFRWTRLLIGGVVTGLAVNIMHYTGMRALRFQGEIHYDLLFVALSVLIAVVAGTAALWFTMVLESTILRFVAGIIMGIAVVGMHYTGMAAVEVVHDAAAPAPQGLEVFSFLFPVFVLGLLALAVPIVAVLTAPNRATARMESAADDLAFEAREFAISN